MSTSTVTALEVVMPGIVPPEGLTLRHREIPAPGAGQLLVAVEATGVSAAEKSMRRGRYFDQPKFPFVPGYDLVGTVLAVGPDQDPALEGSRVACLTKTGGWATHALVSARDSVVVPAGVAPAEAEALIVNGVTAWQMLHESARVRAGQTILVHGAASGVGGIMVQLAHHADLRVLGTASPRHHDALRAAGVEPLDYNDPDLVAKVLALAPNGVDAVFDNVGGPMMYASYRMLARGGALVCYSIMSGMDATGSLLAPFVKAFAQLTLWNVLPNGHRASFYDIWAGHRTRKARFRRQLEEDLGLLFDLLQRGVVTANIVAEYPLEEAGAALAAAEVGSVGGKIILLP